MAGWMERKLLIAGVFLLKGIILPDHAEIDLQSGDEKYPGCIRLERFYRSWKELGYTLPACLSSCRAAPSSNHQREERD